MPKSYGYQANHIPMFAIITHEHHSRTLQRVELLPKRLEQHLECD